MADGSLVSQKLVTAVYSSSAAAAASAVHSAHYVPVSNVNFKSTCLPEGKLLAEYCRSTGFAATSFIEDQQLLLFFNLDVG